jgi:hypothetical protein
MTGSISVHFLFVLLSVAVLSFSETAILAGSGAVLQSVWRRRSQPQLVQVAFNVAALVIASAVAYQMPHWLSDSNQTSNLAVTLVIAACVYFVANTLLVSLVVSLVESKPLVSTWRHCHLWSFPYFLVGAAFAGLVLSLDRSAGWQVSLLPLPLMYLVYRWYQFFRFITPGEFSGEIWLARAKADSFGASWSYEMPADHIVLQYHNRG